MTNHFELYIDESGLFEKNDDQWNQARLIGGVLVPGDLDSQRDRFKGELLEIGKKYDPKIENLMKIHISESREDRKKQEGLRKDLIDYFAQNMQNVRIAFIFHKQSAKEIEDIPGAYLYRNMLVKLLRAVCFYHPFFPDDAQIDCKLAHRRFPYVATFEDFLSGMGYIKLKHPKTGYTEFTAITQAEMTTIMDSIVKTLPFKTRRKVSYEVKPYSRWDNPFMVMADVVCNKIYHLINNQPKKLSVKNLLNEIKSTFSGKNHKDPVLFFSNEKYDLNENLLVAYHTGKFDTFLDMYYRAEKKYPYSDNYLIYPAFKKVTRELKTTGAQLSEEDCGTLLSIAHDFLEDRLFHRLDAVKDILQIVKKTMEQITQHDPDDQKLRQAFLYHDACMRHANHTANIVTGIFHRDKGGDIHNKIQGRTLSDIQKYHEFVNRSSIIDANEFAFERAIARLGPIRKAQENFSNSLGMSARNEILGKIYGSLGQNYAFTGKIDAAAECFQKAAENLDLQNTQQISYRTHLSIEKNDWANFVKEMCCLFKIENFSAFSDLAEICLKDIDRMAFNLHLVLKGCHKFSNNIEVMASVLTKVCQKIAERKSNSLKYHPWELVFTTIGMLYEKIKQSEKALPYYEMASIGFAKNGNEQLTFVMLQHAARARLMKLLLEEKKTSEAEQQFKSIKETFHKLSSDNTALGIYNPENKPDFDGTCRKGWFDDVGNRLLALNDLNADVMAGICDELISRFTFNYW